MLNDFRPGVQLVRRPPSVPELIDSLLHERCGRPHKLCGCGDNPAAGVDVPLPPPGPAARAAEAKRAGKPAQARGRAA